MSFAMSVLHVRHRPTAPGISSATKRIGLARSMWDSLCWWWVTGSLREPQPGLLRAGKDATPPTPMIMTAVLGGRPDHH
jgi:hypothetical protein